MAYLETAVSQICALLTDNSVTAFPEYARRLGALPQEDFVTVGIAQLHCETPLRQGAGWVIPAELTVRVRLHCKTQQSATRLAICIQTILLPGLLDGGYAIGALDVGAAEYVRSIDRLVREVTVVIPAAIVRRPVISGA